MSMQKVKVKGQGHRGQFEFTSDDEIMHKAWSIIEEVPYCFSRSAVKF